MPVDLPTLLQARKTLAIAPDWVARDSPDLLNLTAPLVMDDGMTIAGFRLRGTALKHRPDASVCFQLEYQPLRRNVEGGPFCRIEWRPVKPHQNKNFGPKHLRLLRIAGSHHHRFDLNWQHSPAQVKRGHIPIAEPIATDPANFADLLAFVGKEFRIDGLDSIPSPSWEARLPLTFQHDPRS